MKKKIGILFLISILMATLSSCKAATKEEVTKYVKNTYGEGTLIKTENISEKEIIYYFQDKEYGFSYFVRSKVSDIMIDGSKFGETENKNSDFSDAYYKYVTGQIEDEINVLKEKYGVDILPVSESYNKDELAKICYTTGNIETAAEVSKEVTKLYRSYDTRNYWKYSYTKVYDSMDNRLGKYDVAKDMWMSPEVEEEYRFLEIALSMNSDAIYVRKEEKKFKDTGLTSNDLANILGSEKPTSESIITYYYFKVKGKEFFVADVLLNEDCRWYTNYNEVMGK